MDRTTCITSRSNLEPGDLTMIKKSAALAIVLLLLLSPFFCITPVGADTGSRSTVYSTDFESGEGNWTHGGSADDWELGEPTVSPGYCHSGDNCWGTDLDSDYDSDSNSFLMSPTISLTGATSAFLEFYQWYDLNNFFVWVDRGYVEISDDNGVDFESMVNFTGQSKDADWEKVTVELDAYIGKSIIIRFRLVSDEIFEDKGWFIDDVKVKINEDPDIDKHDLAVTEIGIEPPNPNVNQETYFTIIVENVGDFEESGYTVTIKIADPDTGKVIYEDSKDGDVLDVGEQAKFAFVWKPNGPGMYIVEASVSVDGDEVSDNDTMIVRLRVGQSPHDIAITDLYVVPKTPQVNKLVTIMVVVENWGNVEEVAIPVDLKVFDPSRDLVLEKTKTIDLLGVGRNITLSFPWTPKAPGEYHIKTDAKLKPDAFPENNKRAIFVTIPSGGVDMAVEKLTVEPPDAGPGFERTISAKATNVGSQEAKAVKLTYEITNSTTVVATGSEDLGDIGPGKSRRTDWLFTPDKEGTYTLTVKVKTTDDINGQNDQKVRIFNVPLIVRDVGIESLSALPRTGGLDDKRTVVAEVGNYGDLGESFKTQVTVTDPNGTMALKKEFDTNLAEGDTVVLTTDYTPAAYGEHVVTATTMLVWDTEPSNDETSVTFIVTYHDFHDVGIDTMHIEPRVGNDSRRDISVNVRNYGTVPEVYDVTLEVFNESGGLVETAAEYNITLDVGGQFGNGWNIPINQTGNFTARVEVTIPVDDFLDNNVVVGEFWITTDPLTNDVGIEDLFVNPRTGDKGQQRKMQVRVRNSGMMNESAVPLLVKVTWPGNEEVLYNDVIPGDLLVNDTRITFINWTPPEYATYTVTATVNATVDDFLANDEMSEEFYAIRQVLVDLGVEYLIIEPRTDYVEVVRTISATIYNYGEKAKGKVQIIVRDASGSIVGRKNQTAELGPENLLEVSYDFVPLLIGEHDVEVIVNVIDGQTDVEPTNDRLNMSFLAKEPPPPYDIGVEGVIVPGPWETGRDVTIIVTLRDHGTEPVEDKVNIELEDPEGRKTKWDRKFDIEPGRSTEVTVTVKPVIAGTYLVSAKVTVPLDANPDNDLGKASFDVIAVGGKDASVISLKVEKKEVCGLGFDIEAKVDNVGTVALGVVKVTLTVTGGGKTSAQNVTISLTRGENRTLTFEFTAPSAGSYEFMVKVEVDGDQDMSNNARTEWATACDPANIDTSTTLDPEFPWWLVLMIVVIAVIVIYNYLEYKKKGAVEEPPRKRRPPTKGRTRR